MRLVEGSTDLVEVALGIVYEGVILSCAGHLMLCHHHLGMVRGSLERCLMMSMMLGNAIRIASLSPRSPIILLLLLFLMLLLVVLLKMRLLPIVLLDGRVHTVAVTLWCRNLHLLLLDLLLRLIRIIGWGIGFCALTRHLNRRLVMWLTNPVLTVLLWRRRWWMVRPLHATISYKSIIYFSLAIHYHN